MYRDGLCAKVGDVVLAILALLCGQTDKQTESQTQLNAFLKPTTRRKLVNYAGLCPSLLIGIDAARNLLKLQGAIAMDRIGIKPDSAVTSLKKKKELNKKVCRVLLGVLKVLLNVVQFRLETINKLRLLFLACNHLTLLSGVLGYCD